MHPGISPRTPPSWHPLLLHLGVWLIVRAVRTSPDSGCNSGSVHIWAYSRHEVCWWGLLNCCVSMLASHQWGRWRHAPLWDSSPTHMLLAYWADATHTTEQWHSGRLPNAGRNRTHLLAKHLANWRHPSPLQDPLLASWCPGLSLRWFLTYTCMLPFLIIEITSDSPHFLCVLVHSPSPLLRDGPHQWFCCTAWVCILLIGQFLRDVDVEAPHSHRKWEDLSFTLTKVRSSCHSRGKLMSDNVFQSLQAVFNLSCSSEQVPPLVHNSVSEGAERRMRLSVSIGQCEYWSLLLLQLCLLLQAIQWIWFESGTRQWMVWWKWVFDWVTVVSASCFICSSNICVNLKGLSLP